MLGETRHYGIPATLRGMVNNDLKSTAEAVLSLVKDGATDGVQIDPTLFSQYGIRSVLWRNGGLQPPGEHETSLLPVTLTPEPDNKIPAPVQVEQINTPSDSLCCELVLPAGTLRLKGELTPALLQTLIREMKGSSH